MVNGAGLSDDLYHDMISHQVQHRENDYFGLGWEILTGFSDEEFALIHTGRDPGVNTLAIWFLKSKNGYVVFLNGDNVGNILEEVLSSRLFLGDELWNKR